MIRRLLSLLGFKPATYPDHGEDLWPASTPPWMNVREPICATCGESMIGAHRCPTNHCSVCGKGPLPPTDGNLCDRCWWPKQEGKAA